MTNTSLGTILTAIKDGTHGTHYRTSNGIPFLSAKNISAQGTIIWNKDDSFISESEYELIHSNFCLEKGDILLTIVGSIGRRALYAGEKVTFQRSVAYLRPNKNIVEPKYLFHYFDLDSFKNELISRSNSTAQAGVYLGQLPDISIYLPDLTSQKYIIQILDTIDEAIATAEAQLAKQEKIKQGLLQDLLTRGIDETGQIRPHWEDRPDLYKRTVIGSIPLQWNVNLFDEFAVKIQDGTHFSPKTGNGSFLYITSKNIRFGFIDLSNVETIDEKQHSEIYRRCDVKEGDLLLTKDGANTGNAAINTISEQISLLSSVAFIRFDFDTDVPHFHLQYLLSQSGQRRLKDLMSGNAITRLTLQKIRNFDIPRPSLAEQKTIVEVLSAADDEINISRSEVNKLTLKKTGLMQDLLTGQRPVTPELIRQVETLTGSA